jgi:ribose/xylose/arabinose/galactoside ABC-type transport system permease subunit
MTSSDSDPGGRALDPVLRFLKDEWVYLTAILVVLVLYAVGTDQEFFRTHGLLLLLYRVTRFVVGFLALIRYAKPAERPLLVGILVVLALIYVLDNRHAFFQSRSYIPLFHLVARFGVLAVGAALVIIAGGIDLSTGAVVALASVVSAKLLTEWLRTGSGIGTPPPGGVVALAIGLTLFMGLVIGLFHALLINLLRLPPFIATLASMAGLRSAASVLAKNQTIPVSFESYRMWGQFPSVSLAIFAVVATILSIMMGCTVLGRHIYAMGGNETAALLSGLRTRRIKAIVYGISGMLSALGGILFTGYSGTGDPRLGMSFELTAITAAVVGGCSLAGGIGSIRATVLGLLLTQIVIKGTGIVVRGIDSTQIEGLVLGAVVILAVAFNQLFRIKRE